MKARKLLPVLLSVTASAFVLSGCSDWNNGFTEKELEFEHNFLNVFGDVDPNQDWVALDGGSVNVAVNEDSKILIYAEGLSTNLLLREDFVKAGVTKTIGYDVPVGVKKVSVVAKSDNDWQAKSVLVSETANVDFSKIATRSAVASYTAQPRHKIDFVGGSYTLDGTEGVMQGYFESTFLSPKTWNNSIQYSLNDGWGAYYATNVWPITASEKITDSAPVTNPADIMSLPYTEVAIDDIQEKAIQKIYANTEGNTKLKEHTHDFSIYTKEKGPITLTYVYGVTAGKGGLGYCYTKSNTPEAIKSAPKYMLFVNEQDLSAGQQYHLTFYGEDGNGTPTLEFPEGYYINFFVLASKDGSGLQAWHASEIDITTPKDGYHNGNPVQGEPIVYTDVYGVNNAHMAIYSQIALNDNVSKLIGGGTYKAASTAAWSTLGFNCLSFEDFPDADGVNSDWNDICFLFDANVEQFKTVDESVDYLVACEDLGNTWDFDYNDVVFKVSHVAVFTKDGLGNVTNIDYQPLMSVSLLAAGGTLPAKIWYDVNDNDAFDIGTDIVLFEEAHQSFGVDVKVPVNVGGVTKNPVVVNLELQQLYPGLSESDAETAAAAWRLTDNAKKFKITISNPLNDGDVTTGEDTKLYAVENISAPEQKGSTPSAFIIPTSENASWTWPNENVRINTVYPGWNEWVASREAGAKWYDENHWWNHTPGSEENPSLPEEPTPTYSASTTNISSSTNPAIASYTKADNTITLPKELFTSPYITLTLKMSEGALGYNADGRIFTGETNASTPTTIDQNSEYGWQVTDQQVIWYWGTNPPIVVKLTNTNSAMTDGVILSGFKGYISEITINCSATAQ